MFEKVFTLARNAMAARPDRKSTAELSDRYWGGLNKSGAERLHTFSEKSDLNKHYWDVFNKLGAEREHLVFRRTKRVATQQKHAADFYGTYYI